MLNIKQRIKTALHILIHGCVITNLTLKGLNIEEKYYTGFTTFCSKTGKTVIDYDFKKRVYYNE